MNTPNDCSDDTINELWENGPILPSEIAQEAMSRSKVTHSLEKWSAMLNPETMFHVGEKSYVIDLQRKYAFQFERVGLYSRPEFQCIDVLTFDPEPESTWHLIGKGSTRGEAQCDLLEQIAYAVAHEH